jgi:D-3-phosphoglycerate dehydrogenase
MAKKILFLDPTEPDLWTRLNDLGYQCVDLKTADKAIVFKELPSAFGIIIRSRLTIDKAFIDQASQLAFIARSGVGLEHVDVVYAEEKGIKVINSPEGSRDAVGEHALGLLLMLMNNLARADRQVREGKWIRGGNRGYEIKGKIVGIIGYGNMGQAFAKRLAGFECEVIAYDKYKENYGDQFAKAVSLKKLQEQADIVSLHIPYMAENHYFFDSDLIEGFAKPLWIVNTARGSVLKTEDLLIALESGKVRGAALDVNEYEDKSFATFKPLEQGATFQRLLELPNVILNPHIAGWSFESEEGHARVLAEKIEATFG